MRRRPRFLRWLPIDSSRPDELGRFKDAKFQLRIPELGDAYPPPKAKPAARAKQAGQLVRLGRYGSEFHVWIVNGKQRRIPFG